MKTDKISLILLVALFSSFLISAQPQKMRNGKQRIMEHLELTENQQGQIEKMHQKHQDHMLQLRSELKIKEAELDAALLAESNKEAQSLVAEINELKSAVFSNRIQHQLAVKALLNEDQKRKFDQMILARERMVDRRPLHEARPHHGQGQHRGNRPGQGGN